MYFLPRQSGPFRKCIGIIVTHRDEGVDMGRLRGNCVPAELIEGCSHGVYPTVFVLQRADNRNRKLRSDAASDACKQRVGNMDRVRLLFCLKPFYKAVKFFGLPSVFASKHG